MEKFRPTAAPAEVGSGSLGLNKCPAAGHRVDDSLVTAAHLAEYVAEEDFPTDA